MNDLYKELIIDHGANPRNKKIIENYTHSTTAVNHLCGDIFFLYLNMKNDIIEDISFEGNGCSISIASASIMTFLLKKKTKNYALETFQYFINLIKKNKNDKKEIKELEILSGIKNYPSRVKCGTLIWHSLNDILKQKTNEI